jgi:hypothetical protein
MDGIGSAGLNLNNYNTLFTPIFQAQKKFLLPRFVTAQPLVPCFFTAQLPLNYPLPHPREALENIIV